GEIQYFDNPLSRETLEDSSFRRFFRGQVGIAFQQPEAQLFCPTVEEEISFGPQQLGLCQKEVRERISDLEEIFRLESLLDRYPGELSGGEQRRVVMAAVLAVAPSVLLLDEPTAALDPRSRAELKKILASLGKSGKTLITATHDLTGLERDYDRALVFSEDHRLVWDGRAGEIPKEVLGENNLLDPP
ncbi:MAG TPA: ABC transporter ATP-binding protein, partial [Chroococcales cyanobacterium]